MKVFLSWSGDCSRRAATILHDWLPSVLQSIEPYMSSEDIDTGERWSISIATKLQETDYGIICVTPQNIEAPWLLFESGALSKSIANSRVSPILFGLQQSDLTKSPLIQFQVSGFSEGDIKKLLMSINNSAPDDEKVSIDILSKSFRRAWSELNEAIESPDFQASLSSPTMRPATPSLSGSVETAVQEILANTRSQLKLLNSPEAILPRPYLTNMLGQAGISRGVPSSHPAWSDLRKGTQEIKDVVSLIDDFAAGVSEQDASKLIATAKEDLQSSYRLLRRATEYLYRKVSPNQSLDGSPRRKGGISSSDEAGSPRLDEDDD